MTSPPSSSHSNPDPVIANRPLSTFGRTLHIPLSTSRVARFTFAELCDRPLSAADYLEITNTFGTVFVTDVKKMGVSRKDVVRISPVPVCVNGTLRLHFSTLGTAVHHLHRRLLRVEGKAFLLLPIQVRSLILYRRNSSSPPKSPSTKYFLTTLQTARYPTTCEASWTTS